MAPDTVDRRIARSAPTLAAVASSIHNSRPDGAVMMALGTESDDTLARCGPARR